MEVQIDCMHPPSFHNVIVFLIQAWGSASLDTPDMLGRSRQDSALGLASLETVLAAFASFLAVDGASLLPALEHLDPQAVLLLQHARLQCEVDPALLFQKITLLFRFKVWRQETWREQRGHGCWPERGWWANTLIFNNQHHFPEKPLSQCDLNSQSQSPPF